MTNVRITMHGPADLWRAFRIACLERNISASKVMVHLMEDQLAAWQGSLGRGAGSDYPRSLDPSLTNDIPETLAALDQYLKGS